MTQSAGTPDVGQDRRAGIPESTAPQDAGYSGWAVGWTVFAACMLVLQGMWWGIAGTLGVLNEVLNAATDDWLFRFDAVTWGWIHLVVGLVLVVAGIAVFSAAVWARAVGVVVAGLAMIVAFAWLPWYPVWAMLLIAAAVSSIWALTVHGQDITHVDGRSI